MGQDFEKSIGKASVVRCSVQLKAILGIFSGLGEYQEFSIGMIIPVEGKE